MECLDITPLMRFSEIFGIGRVDDRLLALSGHVALLVRYPAESMVVEILSGTLLTDLGWQSAEQHVRQFETPQS